MSAFEKEHWDTIYGLFHKLWGLAASGDYQKSVWKELAVELEKYRPAIVTPKDSDLYIVRLFDMFDGWTDVSEPLPQNQAQEVWNTKTQHGKVKTKFEDGDYYKVFPANTRMLVTPERQGR